MGEAPFPGAVVAVCGAPAAGKSVFLTCVFRTIGGVLSPHLSGRFSRWYSDAHRFEAHERELIETGTLSGTLAEQWDRARLEIELREPLPVLGRELAVDLRDFAGGHWKLWADPTEADRTEIAPDTREVAARVEDVLERADAVILLISALALKPESFTGREDPFSTSVEAMIERCHTKAIPIALLISQADRNPTLTDEYLHSLPRVRRFEARFTADITELSHGGRPFGLVRRVHCFSVDERGRPIPQTLDGRIWREEPARIVLDLLHAALPRVRGRLQRQEDLEAENAMKKRLEELEAQKVEARRKRRRWIAAWFVLSILLLAGLVGAWTWRERRVAERVGGVLDVVSALQASSLATPDFDALQAALGNEPSGARPEALQRAVGELEAALLAAAKRSLAAPTLSGEHRVAIRSLLELARLVPPRDAAWSLRLERLLEARVAFLDDWLSSASSSAEARLALLEGARSTFDTLEDDAFVALLRATANAQVTAECEAWKGGVASLGGDVSGRLAWLRQQMGVVHSRSDPTTTTRSLSCLGGLIVWSLLDQAENGTLKAVLPRLRPDFAGLAGSTLYLDILARRLGECESTADCGEPLSELDSAWRALQEQVNNRESAVETALANLLPPLLPDETEIAIWNEMLDVLERESLFANTSTGSSAVPTPLAVSARLALADTSRRQEILAELRLRLAGRPIYSQEALFLRQTAAVAWARHRVIEIYSGLLPRLSGGQALDSSALEVIRDRLELPEPEESFDWDPAPSFGSSLGDELKNVLSRLELAESASQRLVLTSMLESRLRAHCQVLENRPELCSDAR